MVAALKAGGTGGDIEDRPLLPLREDLELSVGPRSGDGAPVWLLIDPMKHSFFKISQSVFALVSLWKSGTLLQLASAASVRLNRVVTPAEVEAVESFLAINELTRYPPEGGWRYYDNRHAKSLKGGMHKALHGYLFMRIPLVRPQRFLDAFWPLVTWMFTRAFVMVMALLAFFSLWLVSRQWDVFLVTLASFMSLESFLTYGAALICIKICHELGHAFMAKKYDVAVPTLGVALILLMPILYTDTSAGWRVDRKRRLMMDGAGIFAELTLAVLATVLWVFLPDGPLRSVAFVTATASWVMSLAVNLNPFMRFDGYYILSDLMGFENMQERGFAMARWRLREILFGFGEAPPEKLPTQMRLFIILHAWGTWIYRFFLFLGIALIVYHFAVKLIGLILFAVEIIWFIGRPIVLEIREWIRKRGDIRMNFQTVRTAILSLAAAFLLFVPLPWTLGVPAVLMDENVTQLHPRSTGRVIAVPVSNGQKVRRGDVILDMEAPDLTDQRARAALELKLLQARFARGAADDAERSQRSVLIGEIAAAQARIEAIDQQLNQLLLVAPHDGVFVAAGSNLAPGQWVSPSVKIGILRQSDSQTVLAFADTDRIERFVVGARGVFVPDALELESSDVTLTASMPGGDSAPSIAPLLDLYGGPIATVAGSGEGPTPAKPHYQLALLVDGNIALPAEVRGIVRLEAAPQSIASRVGRRVAGVLLRESGF